MIAAARLERLSGLVPGVVAALIIAGAATFLSDHYRSPVMLFALLLGMAMNFLSTDAKSAPGIQFSSQTILRLGVALLGFRLTFGQVTDLGWAPFALVLVAVAATIAVSVLAARLLGLNPLFGFLSGGATAICGASAALAISAALPAHPEKERATSFTIIGVSVLSTVAMIVYPMIARALQFPDHLAGIFFGATIHDVAQVAGAGYSVSPGASSTAMVVKLTRVAMLLPVILAAAAITSARGDAAPGKRPPLLPWFAIGFVVCLAINSTGALPIALTGGLTQVSKLCLVTAIAALGMKTHLKDLAAVGPKPIVLMLAETVFLAALALIALHFMI